MAFFARVILKFDSKAATSRMKKVSQQFRGMRQAALSFSSGMATASAGARSLALGLAPVSVALGFAAREAIQFEQAMRTVQGIALTTENAIAPLTDEVRRLGRLTEFTATQVASASEELVRGGLSLKQTEQALAGVVDAASVSGETMATTAKFIVGNLNAFNLAASEATRVSDVLALTASRTATDMFSLGEALKLTAGDANAVGMTLEETSFAIGVLSNAGLRGTRAGTALRNAIIKLAKPSEKAIALFGGRKGFRDAVLQTVNGVTKMKPITVIMANIARMANKAKDPLQVIGRAAEVLGLRGVRAFNAFRSQLLQTSEITGENVSAIVKGARQLGEVDLAKKIEQGLITTLPKLQALQFELQGAEGAARRIREIKLQTVAGQFLLLKSAITDLSIAIFGLTKEDFKIFLGMLTDFITTMGTAANVVFQGKDSLDEISEAADSLGNNLFRDKLPMMIAFMQGVRDGVMEIKDALVSAFKFIEPFFGNLTDGSAESAKNLGKLTVTILATAAVGAPALLALSVGLFVLNGGLNLVLSTMTLVSTIAVKSWGAFLAFGKAIIGIFAKVGAVTIGAKLIVVGVLLAISSLIAGLVNQWENMWDALVRMWKAMAIMWRNPLEGIKQFLSATADFFSSWGRGIINVFKMIAAGAVKYLPSSILNFFGADKDSLLRALGSAPSTDPTDERQISETIVEPSGPTKAKTKQKVISSPDISEEMKEMFKDLKPTDSRTGAAIAAAAGESTHLSGRFVIRGKDLVAAVAANQIKNSEANGRTVSPGRKGRAVRNGDVLATMAR